ncbi:MAG: hypothetical protein ACYDEI_00135 [Erysipelotrichaceae bacterium]
MFEGFKLDLIGLENKIARVFQSLIIQSIIIKNDILSLARDIKLLRNYTDNQNLNKIDGPTSSYDEDFMLFDGTSGKKAKGAGGILTLKKTSATLGEGCLNFCRASDAVKIFSVRNDDTNLCIDVKLGENFYNGLKLKRTSTPFIGIGAGLASIDPVATLHLDQGTGVGSSLKFTAGSTTGQTATDGLSIGIDSAGNASINQRENLPLLFYTNGTEYVRLTASGNLCLNTTAAGTSAVGVFCIKTGTAPTTIPADTVQIYSSDLSANNCVLSWFQESGPYAGVGVASTHRVPVRINGNIYYLLATTVG